MSNIRITVPRKLEHLGIPVPPALVSVFTLDATLDEIRADKPVDVLRADLLAGKLNDPAKLRAQITETAQAIVAHEQATTITRELDQPLEHLARVALRESADILVKAMQPRFEAAVAAFLAALDALGRDPGPQLADKSPLLARNYEAWRSAMDDCRAIRSVVSDIDPIDRFAWFTTADTEQARESFNGNEVWGLVRDGVPAKLNTLAEAREVLETARREAEAQADQATADAARAQQERKAELLRERGFDAPQVERARPKAATRR